MTETREAVDEKLARAEGWRRCGHVAGCTRWLMPGGNRSTDHIPDYCASIDAQKPLEALAREKGWRFVEIGQYHDSGTWLAQMMREHDDDSMQGCVAPTEAEARARVLAAVHDEIRRVAVLEEQG